MKSKKRFGVITGGGDCSGLNAVIRAVTKTLTHVFGHEVVGFLDGFQGLVFNKSRPLGYDDVVNILSLGGTILGTSNQDNFFGVKRNESQRVVPTKQNRLNDVRRTMKKHRLDGVICIGGDGTLTVANYLHENGIPMVGVPKTIDNDVRLTDQTFGFDTASSVAAEAIDRVHTSAVSHKRVMVVEVMGRSAGWIALQAGLASGGDIILIPEIPFSMELIERCIAERFKRGRRHCIIVAAEGAFEKGKVPVWKKKSQGLSGVSLYVADSIRKKTGVDSRAIILGHLQRGGTPTPFDRVLATRYGNAAARLAAQGQYGQMVCLRNNKIDSVALNQVAGQPRRVPPESQLLQTARDVGTFFGAL